MNGKELHDRLAGERNLRIRQLIKDGYSTEHIMAVEGADPGTIGEQFRHLKAGGWTRKGKGKTPKKPYGLTQITAGIRAYLGQRLADLAGTKHTIEISTLTGIPQRAQSKANQNPFDYDWRLSEIERLAAAWDIPVAELLLRSMQPPQMGFVSKEVKEKWNSMIERYRIG